jgi:hypothetical protein
MLTRWIVLEGVLQILFNLLPADDIGDSTLSIGIEGVIVQASDLVLAFLLLPVSSADHVHPCVPKANGV